jgi:PST family polysaccharide transporter
LFVPRLGVVGYGIAEAIGLVSYLVLHREVVRRIGNPEYRVALVWGTAFGMAFFWYQLGLTLLVGLALALAWPLTWKVLRDYWRQLQEARL